MRSYLKKNLWLSCLILIIGIILVYVIGSWLYRSSYFKDVRRELRFKEVENYPRYKSYFDDVKEYLTQNPYTFPSNFYPGRIFVSIASYRDPECPKTIQSLLEMAARPDLITIGVCEQNAPEDFYFNVRPGPGIKVLHMSDKEARGPTWARYLAQRMWEGEEYFLQIDAHTRFEKNWDSTVKRMLSQCPSKKPILTQYLSEYNIKNNKKEPKRRGPLYVQKFDDTDGFTRIQSDWSFDRSSVPFPSKAWSACFSFGKASMLRDVMYDPFTPYLFFGEEMDYTLRLFTHGYDFYSPQENIAHTNFDRSYRKTFWEQTDQRAVEKLSRLRLYHKFKLLPSLPDGLKTDLNYFNMGTSRTIKDYERFARIDIAKEKLI